MIFLGGGSVLGWFVMVTETSPQTILKIKCMTRRMGRARKYIYNFL